MDVGRQKLPEKLRLSSVARNPFARNGRWTSKTEEKLRLWGVPRHEMDVGRQKMRKNCDLGQSQPFRTKWTLDVKNWGKIATLLSQSQPFRTKWTLDVKNWGKIATLRCQSQPLRTKWTLDVKNWGKIARQSQPFRTKWTLDVKNWGKIATLLGQS